MVNSYPAIHGIQHSKTSKAPASNWNSFLRPIPDFRAQRWLHRRQRRFKPDISGQMSEITLAEDLPWRAVAQAKEASRPRPIRRNRSWFEEVDHANRRSGYSRQVFERERQSVLYRGRTLPKGLLCSHYPRQHTQCWGETTGSELTIDTV